MLFENVKIIELFSQPILNRWFPKKNKKMKRLPCAHEGQKFFHSMTKPITEIQRKEKQKKKKSQYLELQLVRT